MASLALALAVALVIAQASALFDRVFSRSIANGGEATTKEAPGNASTVHPACSLAYHVVAEPPKCSFPYKTEINMANHVGIYHALAEVSELIYHCSGLRASGLAPSKQFLVCNEPQRRICTDSMDHKHVHIDSPWGGSRHPTGNNVGDAIDMCLMADEKASGGMSERCNAMAWCSLAWKQMNAHQHPESLPANITAVISQHHRLLGAYTRGPAKDIMTPCPACFMFPKPKRALCGGLQPYHGLVSDLEPLYPDGRNMMYHEYGNLIDFTPYLPLPSVSGFSLSSLERGRKILLVAGANGFYRAPKFLMDSYSPYFKFDLVYLFEPDPEAMEIPADYQSGVTFVQTFLQVGSRDDRDLITFLHSHVHEDDYVVLMFDVDEGIHGPTMEWGFLADLAAQRRPLVDEFYTELHFKYPGIGWDFDRHTGREAHDVLSQMRQTCGFAVHAWP